MSQVPGIWSWIEKYWIRSLISFWGNCIVNVITSQDWKIACDCKPAWSLPNCTSWTCAEGAVQPQRRDTSQCPGQGWPWKIIDNKRLPGNRTRYYGELWMRDVIKENRSRVRARQLLSLLRQGVFIIFSWKGSLLLWTIVATYLPSFPLHKGNFNWTMNTSLQGDTPVPDGEHHTPTRVPELGPRHSD